jgi:hypothetical protein
MLLFPLIPAQAGIQRDRTVRSAMHWVSALAGTSEEI